MCLIMMTHFIHPNGFMLSLQNRYYPFLAYLAFTLDMYSNPLHCLTLRSRVLNTLHCMFTIFSNSCSKWKQEVYLLLHEDNAENLNMLQALHRGDCFHNVRGQSTFSIGRILLIIYRWAV